MRINLPSLHVWAVVNSDGIKFCAHCNCMAGLGEVCSHKGAVFFALEAWNITSKSVDDEVNII